MSAANLLASFAATMVWEGGERLSLVRSDPGNWTSNRVGVGRLVGTRWGVSAGSHPTLDILNLTRDQAAAIFLTDYWTPVNGDALPVGLDHCVSDAAYNEGPRAALSFLGKSGFATRGEPLQAIKDFSSARLQHLRNLSTWRVFGVGWARRVGGVEGESLRMAMGEIGVPAAAQEQAIRSHAEAIRMTAHGHAATAGGAILSGAATSVGAHTDNAPQGVLWAVGGIFVLVAVVFVAQTIIKQARADGLIGKK